jgi:hypothetical protein
VERGKRRDAASQSELGRARRELLEKGRKGGEVGFARRRLAPNEPDLPLGLGCGKTQEADVIAAMHLTRHRDFREEGDTISMGDHLHDAQVLLDVRESTLSYSK